MKSEAFINSLNKLDEKGLLEEYYYRYPDSFMSHWKVDINGKLLLKRLAKSEPQAFAEARIEWASVPVTKYTPEQTRKRLADKEAQRQKEEEGPPGAVGVLGGI